MSNQGHAVAVGSMSALLVALRHLRGRIEYLRGYFDLDLRGNVVERRSDFAHGQKPLLLLHGFFATRRTLDVLERRFRRDGYCVFSLNLGGIAHTFNTRGIDDLAELVRAKVERLYRRHPGLGPLTVVGHSEGGLIGAYYVKRLGGHRRVRTLVTLGTPHGGSPFAYAGLPLGFLARSLWQITPVSPFLKRLQRGEWPAGVRVVSLYSRRDLLAPYPAARVDPQGVQHVRNREVVCKHREFLYKARVYRVILEEIREGERASALEGSGETAHGSSYTGTKRETVETDRRLPATARCVPSTVARGRGDAGGHGEEPGGNAAGRSHLAGRPAES